MNGKKEFRKTFPVWKTNDFFPKLLFFGTIKSGKGIHGVAYYIKSPYKQHMFIYRNNKSLNILR